MSKVSYQDVYVVNVVLRSIAGRSVITEEDLGLKEGTLPPTSVASLGSLITIDRELLRPFHTLRTRTQRYCEGKGVKVGLGYVVPASELPSTLVQLEKFKDEFYDEKRSFLAGFRDTLDERMQSFPDYSDLLKASAPTYDYVEKRLQYDIDVVKLATPVGDPNEKILASTLRRDGNDISSALLKEIAAFCRDIYERALRESQSVCKRNLTPLRNTLLPKLRSFQLLDGRISPVTALLESVLNWADKRLAEIPKGDPKKLVDGDFRYFCESFDQLRSENLLNTMVDAHSSQNIVPAGQPASKAPQVAPKPPPDVPSHRPASSSTGRVRPAPRRINF